MPPLTNLARRARADWATVEAALQGRPLLWSIVLSAAIAIAFTLTLSPGYDTNDDVVMQSLVDGTMGKHSAHMVFTNVLIGLALSTLYRAVDWFPWYGLYLYLVHFACLLAVVYVGLAAARGRLWVRLASLAAVLAVFHLSMWMQLQFTSTAMLLAASGVMLYFAVAEGGPSRWGVIVTGGAMVGFSAWIRGHSALAVALLAFPVFALTLRRIPWRRTAVFAGTAAAIVLAGWIAETAHYADKPDWQAYAEFNERRDYVQQAVGPGEIDPAVLAEVGWSPNDLAIFGAWFFADETVHEAADLEVIADSLPADFRPTHALAVLAAQAGGWLGATRLAVVVALAALAWVEGGRRAGAPTLVAAAAVLMIAFGLAGTYRLPDRVAVGLLAFLPLISLSLPGPGTPDGSPHRRRARVWHGAAAVVSVMALVVGGANALALDRQHHTADADLREALSGFTAIGPDGVFVAWATQIQTGAQALSPWRRGGLGGPPMIVLGWPERSPVYEAQLARLGIEDLYAAVAARPDVYLPMRIEARGGMYLRYLEEHYGFSGLLRPAAEVGAYTVYDGVASFDVEDSADTLVEHRFDGSVVSYRIVPAHGLGSTIVLPLWPRGFLIAGSADADLIVVTYRGEAIALARPDPAVGGDSGSPGFALTVYRAGRSLRVFAISDGRAANITP